MLEILCANVGFPKGKKPKIFSTGEKKVFSIRNISLMKSLFNCFLTHFQTFSPRLSQLFFHSKRTWYTCYVPGKSSPSLGLRTCNNLGWTSSYWILFRFYSDTVAWWKGTLRVQCFVGIRVLQTWSIKLTVTCFIISYTVPIIYRIYSLKCCRIISLEQGVYCQATRNKGYDNTRWMSLLLRDRM